jgi:hypothetical protein
MNKSPIFNRTYLNKDISSNNPIICKNEYIRSINDPENTIKLADDAELYCSEILCNLNGCEIKIESKLNRDNKLYVKDIVFYINGFAIKQEGLQEITLDVDTKLKIKNIPILIKDITNNYVKIQPISTNELIINYKSVIVNPINYNVKLENELPIEIINTQKNKLDDIFSSFNKIISQNRSNPFIESFDDISFIKKNKDSSDNISIIKKNKLKKLLDSLDKKKNKSKKLLDSSDNISIIKKNLLDSSEEDTLILSESTINTSDIVLISDEI